RMENGEWRMENGEWRMENGEWRMENGEWRMENGEWRMENGAVLKIAFGNFKLENRELFLPKRAVFLVIGLF
ncbi:MAG: hypothetical protein FWD13_11205, partial [Treponema sp.]|nr:hypothetical protein [Treponema sp.]